MMTRTKKRLDVAELRKELERTHPRDVAREYIERVCDHTWDGKTRMEGTVYSIGRCREVDRDSVMVFTTATRDEVVRAIASIIESDREARA